MNSVPPDAPTPPSIPDGLDLPTQAGRFTLVPIDAEGDLDLICKWMNDPAVSRYWELDGPCGRTAEHLAEQQSLAHTRPYLAHLEGRPLGYWEIYRAADDRLAAYYPALRDDLGIHLLIGAADRRGHGLGAVLLTAVCDALQVDGGRIVAEPDVRNTASLRTFLAAGFHQAGAIELPEKRATLMIREAPA